MSANQRHQGWSYPPAGTLCAHCNYRPAAPNRRAQGRAKLYCSDQCRKAEERQRERQRRLSEAEAIRRLLGLPTGRGADFTRPELEAIHRRLDRLVPAGGLSHYPARRRAS